MSTEPIAFHYYISSGAQNAMHTLRCSTRFRDYYICNLAIDFGKAVDKANAYVEAIKAVANPEGTIIHTAFCEVALDKRRKGLTMKQTRDVEMIEAGIFPFGKHVHEPIKAAPASYILFFADKNLGDDPDPVMDAFVAACRGVALELGYYEERLAKQREIAEARSMSNWVGEAGKRFEFTATIKHVFVSHSYYGFSNTVIMQAGTDTLVYRGSAVLGAVGDTITGKAGVKKHDEYKGGKQTVLERPNVVKVA